MTTLHIENTDYGAALLLSLGFAVAGGTTPFRLRDVLRRLWLYEELTFFDKRLADDVLNYLRTLAGCVAVKTD